MLKLKIFLFNRLANLAYKIGNSSHFIDLQSKKHTKGLKSIGENSKFHPHTFIINPQYIVIGDNFLASWNLRIEAISYYKGQGFSPQIIIGDNVAFNTDVHIGCIDKVEIGDNCLFASKIFISDHDHGDTSIEDMNMEPRKRPLRSKGPVIIGDNCWIGEGAAILSGVTIGRNSIVATNSVVTKDIPEFCIAAGIPAKVIKKIK